MSEIMVGTHVPRDVPVKPGRIEAVTDSFPEVNRVAYFGYDGIADVMLVEEHRQDRAKAEKIARAIVAAGIPCGVIEISGHGGSPSIFEIRVPAAPSGTDPDWVYDAETQVFFGPVEGRRVRYVVATGVDPSYGHRLATGMNAVGDLAYFSVPAIPAVDDSEREDAIKRLGAVAGDRPERPAVIVHDTEAWLTFGMETRHYQDTADQVVRAVRAAGLPAEIVESEAEDRPVYEVHVPLPLATRGPTTREEVTSKLTAEMMIGPGDWVDAVARLLDRSRA